MSTPTGVWAEKQTPSPDRETKDLLAIQNAAHRLQPGSDDYVPTATLFSNTELKNIAEQLNNALSAVHKDGRFVTLSQNNGVVRISCVSEQIPN